MFYTESITIKATNISLWSKIVNHFEKIGNARAKRELQRLGYTQEYLDLITSKKFQG